MSKKLKFIKMHGIGNDFVVVDSKELPANANFETLSKKLNDRRFGIGGDGLILVLPSSDAEFEMRMFNPDGSEAEMCGNGIRCFAKYLYDRKMITKLSVNVKTGAGILDLQLEILEDEVKFVTVDMGEPILEPRLIPMAVLGQESAWVNKPVDDFLITAVSMGNPHAVIFVDDVSSVDIHNLGPNIENHSIFPQKTNVHWVEVISENEIKMITWERGAGVTFACGTGACACAVASNLNNKTARKVLVHLKGGDLTIDWKSNNHVFMSGPAEEVFKGEINICTEAN